MINKLNARPLCLKLNSVSSHPLLITISEGEAGQDKTFE